MLNTVKYCLQTYSFSKLPTVYILLNSQRQYTKTSRHCCSSMIRVCEAQHIAVAEAQLLHCQGKVQ
jgi:hypothetical protein